jgi:outer membrane lipoprotein-sorting protein
MKVRRAFLLIVALWMPTARALDVELAELMALLSGVTTSTDSFIETRKSALFSAPLVLKGQLVYGKPDRLEKHVLSPYEETTVVNNHLVSIENRTLKQKRSFNLSASMPAAALIEGMRATLAGDVSALERHYDVRLEGSQEAWLLTLRPRDKKLAEIVSKIRIAGARERLKRIEVDENSGDQSVMLIGSAMP